MRARSVMTYLLTGLCALGLSAMAVGLSRCFSPELPACAYRCNTAEPSCPDEYECRADRYCHLRGSTESCPYTMDLLPLQLPDLRGFGADMSSSDAGASDMGAADAATDL